jgi:cation transport ATPase
MIYAIALRKSLNNGVLIKETSSIDDIKSIDTIVFDKTGTITGTYNVGKSRNMKREYDDGTLWEMISVIEKEHLAHPIGLALYQEANKKLGKLPKSKIHQLQDSNDISDHKYFGSEGIVHEGLTINGKSVSVGLGNAKMAKRLTG